MISPQQKITLVNWTRLEQDSNSSFIETLSKLLGRIWATYYALLCAKRFLEGIGLVDPPKHRSFLSQNLNVVASEIGYIQLSLLQGGHSISSLPRTKPNLEVGGRLLSIFLIINSIEDHQNLIQQLSWLSVLLKNTKTWFNSSNYLLPTMAISNMVVWGLNKTSHRTFCKYPRNPRPTNAQILCGLWPMCWYHKILMKALRF